MDKKKIYSNWFIVPAMVIFTVFFLLPMVISFFFSMTVWDFNSFTFCGFDNFKTFFSDSSLYSSVINTLIYAILTCGLKLIIAFFLAVFLTSKIKTKNFLRSVVFFPNLISTIAVGITFCALMHPSKGLINQVITMLGGTGMDWLGNTKTALYAVILTDVWKGVGVATVIFIAGMQSIDKTYYEAASIDGATAWEQLKAITVPLSRPAMNSVIILAFIGGMRTFDLIWAMTGGGPGYATEVMASTVYKQYAAGFYGLSTAGNVIMFAVIALLAFPLQKFLLSKEAE
ncbi:sugar ABC transporter permease [Clostridium sp. AF19-22AC]|jgi:raffinose/stachyose/melibiose transport system permease protein|uniref:Raffinose/stachyose/melibiose transport system permease protein n=1 Tax=Faecalicatena orotica TaxID=1544 RepID=A0A2Y9BJB1_9FIRM|nr:MULTISPECIES: sugar ABC transporter permease [Clostridia]PWJ23425.1 raffinose/stachyose/melibiose transport system permease protein [Faecalicatena orotica]RHR32900.1 sugar ABC transporter permease [Clostridium sp. AF19-22AC]SSA57683.1 raffinose/stachyose/melibiose transport system permease protein [Faecalicatena orotica]